MLIMRLFTNGLSLALLSFCFLGLAGCGEDNEAAINEQASKAKETIPGARSPQAKTQEEYYNITYGIQGVGTGKGSSYPGEKVVVGGRSCRNVQPSGWSIRPLVSCISA